MYTNGEFFTTMDFKTVNKPLWTQVFNKPEHHAIRKEVGVTFAAYSSDRRDPNLMSVVFKYDEENSMNDHSQRIHKLLDENREKWSALGDIDSIKFSHWRILSERVNDMRFEDVLNKSDDVFWMARHTVGDKKKWVAAMKAQQDAGFNYNVRWWGLMENLNDENEVSCVYRLERDRVQDFVMKFCESLKMFNEMATVDTNECEVKFVNIEWETMYQMPASLQRHLSDDKNVITGIINDMCNKDYKLGMNHTDKDCLFIRPTGNPLNMKGWEMMMTSEDVNVEENSLVKINKMKIVGSMAYVCYTTHGKFTYKGVENDDIAVITSVLEKDNGTWKVIHGQRSTGRKPDDPKPDFGEV